MFNIDLLNALGATIISVIIVVGSILIAILEPSNTPAMTLAGSMSSAVVVFWFSRHQHDSEALNTRQMLETISTVSQPKKE